MPPKKISFDDVRRIGLAMPSVEEGTAYGSPALKLHGALMACIPTHRSAEPDSLVVRLDFPDRDELVAAAPETYYLPDHYMDYACVLVRLSRIDSIALRDLLGMAWTFVNTKRPVKRRSARSPARR